MDFIGRKLNGKMTYDPAVEQAKIEAWNKIKDGMVVNMPIVVPKKGKSHAQCKLIFGNMITNAVKQANEKHITTEQMMIFLLNDAKNQTPNGVPVDIDFLHAFMYVISPTFSEDGKPITLNRMDTRQASRLFEVTRAFLARMGIVIDDPPKLENDDPDLRTK